MHAPTTIPLMRRLVRWLAYGLLQLALLVAFAFHSAAALCSPFRLGCDVRSSAWFKTRPHHLTRINPHPVA